MHHIQGITCHPVGSSSPLLSFLLPYYCSPLLSKGLAGQLVTVAPWVVFIDLDVGGKTFPWVANRAVLLFSCDCCSFSSCCYCCYWSSSWFSPFPSCFWCVVPCCGHSCCCYFVILCLCLIFASQNVPSYTQIVDIGGYTATACRCLGITGLVQCSLGIPFIGAPWAALAQCDPQRAPAEGMKVENKHTQACADGFVKKSKNKAIEIMRKSWEKKI